MGVGEEGCSLAFRPPHPHPCPTAVLGDELDAGGFERALDRIHVRPHHGDGPGLAFSPLNGQQTYTCTLGKLDRTPLNHSARGPYLFAS